MTPFISLISSGLLLAALLFIRDVEMRRGTRYFAHVRERLDRAVVHGTAYVTSHLPVLLVRASKYVIMHVTDLLSSHLLRGIRFLEGKVHGFVHRVRGKKRIVLRKPTSSYLNAVKNHKEQIRRENGYF